MTLPNWEKVTSWTKHHTYNGSVRSFRIYLEEENGVPEYWAYEINRASGDCINFLGRGGTLVEASKLVTEEIR